MNAPRQPAQVAAPVPALGGEGGHVSPKQFWRCHVVVVNGRCGGALEHVLKGRAVNRVVEDGVVGRLGNCAPRVVRVNLFAHIGGDMGVIHEYL